VRKVVPYWTIPSPLPRDRWAGGELLGLRAWRLVRWNDDQRLRLQSLGRDAVWHGPVFAADAPPCAANESGVYALKPGRRPRSRHASGSGYADDWLAGSRTWIWGWVALSGEVVEHERGYRAQRAVVRRLRLGSLAHLAFDGPAALADTVRDLEDRYQCPVKLGSWESAQAARIRGMLPAAPPQAVPLDGPGVLPRSVTYPAPAQVCFLAASAVARAPDIVFPARVSLKPRAVAAAFVKAERKLGKRWPLQGRGHCRRASLLSQYSRVVRQEISSWELFHPHEATRRVIVFPFDLIVRAANLLHVKPRDLISSEY